MGFEFGKDKTIAVVVAHADDEVLGCGGAIARHVASGDSVHIIFLTNGVGSRGGDNVSEAILSRRQARVEALSILGVEQWTELDYPDNCMDSVPLLDIVKSLEAIFDLIQPYRVYTHHFGDLNVDHRVVHAATMTACRPIPNGSVKEIFTFEVMSSTEWATPTNAPFIPNGYVNISDYLSIKLRALAAYGAEMRATPHSRSIANLESLARYRGNCVGVEAAEAFEVIRVII